VNGGEAENKSLKFFHSLLVARVHATQNRHHDGNADEQAARDAARNADQEPLSLLGRTQSRTDALRCGTFHHNHFRRTRRRSRLN
jgi:hypothetical protein